MPKMLWQAVSKLEKAEAMTTQQPRPVDTTPEKKETEDNTNQETLQETLKLLLEAVAFGVFIGLIGTYLIPLSNVPALFEFWVLAVFAGLFYLSLIVVMKEREAKLIRKQKTVG